jgi:hypothetical protein
MKTTLSNVFVIVYIGVTLLIRFILEPQLQGRFLISVGLGLFALLFLWALIRSKVIRPSFMGLDKMINKEP